MEEGFEINHRKTRSMHRSHRQLLTGMVVNEKANVRRDEFDRLKAILTNCARQEAPGDLWADRLGLDKGVSIAYGCPKRRFAFA